MTTGNRPGDVEKSPRDISSFYYIYITEKIFAIIISSSTVSPNRIVSLKPKNNE